MKSSPPAFLFASSMLLAAVKGGQAQAAYYSYEYCHSRDGGDGTCGTTYVNDRWEEELTSAMYRIESYMWGASNDIADNIAENVKTLY